MTESTLSRLAPLGLLVALASGCAQPLFAPANPELFLRDGVRGDGLEEVIEEEQRQPFLAELTATLRGSDEDEVFGAGFYSYPETGWGFGLQVHSTVRGTDPELEVVLNNPAAELEPRNSEFAFDGVVTRRLDPNFGVFAGVGIVTVERYRRFLDNLGNDFYVRTDRDYRLNGTAGAHLWLTDRITISAQYDTYFEAATVGIGFEF